jgi:putative transposase
MRKPGELDTIWEVPDSLWEQVEAVLAEPDPPRPQGRPRADARKALNGIIFRMRSGCHWNRLPKEFGDDSTLHRTFQRWVERGVFVRVWAMLIESCDELGGVEWTWQAADGAMGKARSGGSMSGATRRTGARPGRSGASLSKQMEDLWPS